MRPWLLALGLAWLAGSCAAPAPHATSVWAERVLDLRRSADDHLSRGQLAAARADLRRILALEPPKGDERSVQLLQDAHFALASIQYGLKRYEQALAETERGLRVTKLRSIFAANLHALRAMCLEATNKELDAITDYQVAIGIHKELFDAALREHR